MKILADKLSSLIKFAPWVAHLSVVFVMISISMTGILLMPDIGRTEPQSYDAEVSEGQRLVKEFGELTANPNTPRKDLVSKTVEIFQSQQAKQILKGSQKSLGKIYNDIVYVGDDSIVSQLLSRTKEKLRNFPPDVLERLQSIRNKSSIASGSAPMDLDIGLITGGDKTLERELLKKLGGVDGVRRFEEALQKALIESFTEIAAEAGVTGVNAGKLDITGTTPWNMEAYGQSGVLKGDAPDAQHAGQAGDVTKSKTDKEAKAVAEKIKSQESAWQEAARGTLKDRAKMESAFNEVFVQAGGRKPVWSNEQKKVWEYLEQLGREGITGEEIRRINAEIKKLTGEDIFGACKILADKMEAAWKLRPGLKLTPGQFIEVLITNKDGSRRRVLIDDQITMRGEGEADSKAFQILRDIINRARGNEFINAMLANQTARNLLGHAVIFAPMALMNMFVKWEMGQMNDVHELAAALVQVVPLESGFELMYVGDKSIADAAVLKAFLNEGFFWGLAAYCQACAPLLIGAAVGEMGWSLVKFKAESVRLQSYHSGLVDLIAYNGEFPEGKFAKLTLPEQVIERWDMRRFLFETKAVKIKIAVPDWGVIINNLSEKTEEVYNKYYLANDPAMQQLKEASAQLEKNAGCNKNSTEKYCRVYDLIQRQMEMRRQEVIDAVMIPHLIRLAEEKRATLNAPEELKDDLDKLQAELETLRGSSLGEKLKLSEEVSKRASEEAKKNDIGEEKKLARGEYWQKAVKTYQGILNAHKKLKSDIPNLTGFERARILQIIWTGDYEQDHLRSAQSLDGFHSDAGKIIGDIADIKGAGLELKDIVDKQALELLGSVVFPWRASLDSSNRADTPSAVFGAKRFPVPGKNTSFYKEYEDALESVRELYGRKKDFQDQLERGARIVKEKESLFLGDSNGTGLKLEFTDKELKKNWDDAILSIRWTANPAGTFRPDTTNLTTKFTAGGPEPVTISVKVEKRGKEKMTGTLEVVVPVKVPDGKAKDDHQDKPGAPSVAGQPEPSVKGQEGMGSGASAETGVRPGPDGQTGVPGQTEAGVKGETRVPGQTETGIPGKTDAGAKGEAGVAGGQSGQAGASGQPPGAGEGDKPVKEPTGADLKGRAEGRYKWIKDVLDYHEKLIELEKKAFQAFEKQVREFVMKKAAAGGYPVRDKETEKKIERLEEELKNVGVYVVKERTTDPLTGESFLGNVVKGQPPTPAEKVKAEELAELKDPMSHEEFQCLDKGLQVRRDRLPEIKEKAKVVRASKLYNNFAEYSAWNQYKEYLSELEALKSRLNLPDPIPSPVILPWSYSSSCGGAVVAPTKPKLAVVLVKTPDKASYKPGDIVNISAVVTGGKEPYEYTWSGNHAGKGQQVSVISSKPGDYTVSVEVKDVAGAGGSGSITLAVKGITASIEGLAGQVIYGTSRLISVSSQDIALATAKQPADTGRKKGQPKERKPAGKGNIMVSPDEEPDHDDGEKSPLPKAGGYRFVWFSDTEGLSFNPSTSNNPVTEVLFTRMGPIKIWADIQKQTGEGVYSTIGEAKQEAVTVIPPRFKWKFEPPKGNGKVGREVKATLTTEPDINADLIHYEWSYPESSNRMEYEKNASVIGFVPKEPTPMMLLVAPTVPHYREPIGGGLKEDYQAGAYTVAVTGPKAAGPKPQVWSEKEKGLVEVEKGIAVHQRVEFSAEVSPKPESELRYNWTVSGGKCTLSNPMTRDVGVTCSETGSYVMTVTVRDKENIELGKGTGNLAVTISQEELDKTATKAQLKVTVTAEKITLTIGESTSATATVDGGKSPYRYTWSGEYQGQGQSVRFSPKKPGDHTLSVEVTDAKGNKDSANITFRVDALKVTIGGLRDEVVYGTKLNLNTIPENHQIVWRSEPAITFTPQQSLGGKTIASFNSIGRVKVWAVAQQNTGVVIGESEKQEINVIPPKFEITFDPPKGKVGDEITATVKTVPEIDKSLLKFVWESPRRSDIRPYDTNIVRFTPKSIAPVEFVVIAKEPVRSQSLAEIRGTYTAEAVRLDVVLKADKTRLKPGESANIRADVKGGKTPYTFNWKGDYKGYGSAVRFYAQKSGQQRLHVDVIDAIGNRGSADIKLDVDEIHVDKPYDKGPAKTPTVLTPFPPPGMLGHPQEEYDPRKDSGFTGPGAGPTSSDVASANTVGSEFQQGLGGGSTATSEQTPQNVAQQPESYTTDPGKKPDNPTGAQQPYYPPSSQGYSPDSGQSNVRTPWDRLVGPSSGYSTKSSGRSGDPGTSAPTSSSTPPSSNIRSSGTSAPSPPSPKPIASVTAEITNRSKGNVHIFTDGETFGPGNRFESGKMKRVNVSVPSNNKITFYAGRNGQIIASKSWYYDPNNPSSIPVVIFDESNPYDKLVIMKGLR